MREINRINNIKKFNELFDKTNEELNWFSNDNYERNYGSSKRPKDGEFHRKWKNVDKQETEEISPIVSKTYTEEDMENAFEAGKDSLIISGELFDIEQDYTYDSWLKNYNSNK